MKRKCLIILGIRGVPASHGGFETFADHLCRYLAPKGWQIFVYCQEQGTGPRYTSKWEGVTRIHIPIRNDGPLSTIIFDFKAILHSLRYRGVFLTLGYNTAIFNTLLRVFAKTNLINMDGIEWKRRKWGMFARAWFWVNERAGCWVGDALIADHPEIENHLATRVSRRKITMIPYGGKEITFADELLLHDWGLEPDRYALVVARPEPENSILEIVTAFAQLKTDFKLVVLGNFQPESNRYHRQILDEADERVLFPGAIYEAEKVDALRFYARVYVHGHQVGGTNPSLVEAIGAGSAILAHDNKFNRWVAGDGALYFSDIASLQNAFLEVLAKDSLVEDLRTRTRRNFETHFRWDLILSKYEELLEVQQ